MLPTRGGSADGRSVITFRLDFSWLPAAALLAWWAATVSLPASLPGRPATMYWLMAVVLVIGGLLSVVLHEVAHTFVARRYGPRAEPALVFPFGAVRDRDAGSHSPESDLLVALTGPVASALAAVVLLLGAEATAPASPQHALVAHLALLNGALAAINLLPAFPLDGGRAVRSVLWVLRGDFGWATTTSSRLGSAIGLATILMGILIILGNGTPTAGIALLLFGFTLRSAAGSTYQHLLTRSSLQGIPVRQLMDDKPIAVQRALSISSLVEDFIYKHQLKMLPVVDGERLLGYVTAQRVKELPREEWSRQSIGTIVLPFSTDNTVSPDTDAMEALDKMTRTGNTRLMVVEGGRLAGILALHDLLGRLRSQPLSGDASS